MSEQRNFVIRPQDRDNGWQVLQNCRAFVRDAVSHYTRRGQAVQVTVGPYRKRRSRNQNELYWACYVQPLAEATGYSTNEMHTILKWEFLPPRQTTNPLTGEVIEVEPTTTALSTAEFTHYLEQITALAAQYGIAVGPQTAEELGGGYPLTPS